MDTAWLQKAFVDLAGKSSGEAQEMLRRWVTSRMLSMNDYSELADRLTASYLERDTRRAANLKGMRRAKTGQLPPLGGDKPSRSKTGQLPPLGGDKPARSSTAKLPPLPSAKPGSPPGPPTTLPGGQSQSQGQGQSQGQSHLRSGDTASGRPPAPPNPAAGTRPLQPSRTEPFQPGRTEPLSDRYRSRPPGSR